MENKEKSQIVRFNFGNPEGALLMLPTRDEPAASSAELEKKELGSL